MILDDLVTVTKKRLIRHQKRHSLAEFSFYLKAARFTHYFRS
ncbi:MAG: hypothetical protein ACFWTI_06070 [Lactobacillus helveticus]|jgi:hypothetical protein